MLENVSTQKANGECRGATLVEFALVGALFFVLLLGTFEAARVSSVRAALMKGAQDGAVYAAQRPEMFLDYGNFNANCSQFDSYNNARVAAMGVATRFPLSLFISPSTGTNPSQQLVEYRYTDEGITCPGAANLTPTDAMVMRPPRSGIAGISPREDYFNPTFIPSGTVPYPGTGKTMRFGLPVGTPNYGSILGTFPICVELQANVRLGVGFFGTYRIEGHACSFQEGAGQANTSAPSVTLTPTPTPTPSATATASPSATPTPSRTPTPTGSATPTPSRTPTPTGSATPTGSPTPTPSPSSTPTPSATPTPSSSATPTASATTTPTPTPTLCPWTTSTCLASSQCKTLFLCVPQRPPLCGCGDGST